MHAHRAVRPVGDRHQRVTVARRRVPKVLFSHVDAVDELNAQAALHEPWAELEFLFWVGQF